MKIFLKSILLVLVLCIFTKGVQACTCKESEIPVCEQYRRADAVFVGRVKNVEPQKAPSALSANTVINFEVERSFKGTSEPLVKVGYIFGTSCSWIEKFNKGERWLIYGYRNEAGEMLTIPFCTGSYRIGDDENAEITYFNNLLQGKTKETIIGKLVGEDISNNTRITIKGNDKTYTAQTDDNGDYKVEVAGAGNYRVRAAIPFSVIESSFGFNGYSPLDIISATEKETIVEYDIQVEKGLCGYRQINFQKFDLKATASIGGKVVGDDGKPIKNLTLRLAKAVLSERDALNRNLYDTTDENGAFEFPELREGRYIIVINPNDFPYYDMPYLKTFYPGVRNYSDAQIIEIEQEQKISDIIFQMPKELPQREIQGKIVWADGKPVTEKEKPFLYLYNLKAEYVSRPFDFFKVDDDGNFSFSLFEGFTYLVKIEAHTKTGQHHGFAKIKVDKKLKPLKIILNRQGNENVEDFLKEIEGKKP